MEAGLAVMRNIGELHLERPSAGARMLRDMLRRDAFQIGRKHAAMLMARIGIQALYRKPNTNKRRAAHTACPYLLRNLRIDRPNQVRATDVTDVPMNRSFVCKGCWRDNVFVEWLWKSVNCEAIYSRAFGTVTQARPSLVRYFDLYNREHPHSSLDAKTPDEAHCKSRSQRQAA